MHKQDPLVLTQNRKGLQLKLPDASYGGTKAEVSGSLELSRDGLFDGSECDWPSQSRSSPSNDQAAITTT